MPATRTSFSCGHRGWGSACHRCQTAATFEALANAGKGKPKSKKPNSKEWTAQELKAEAERLRSV